jgi:uncharacterized protein YoxC
VKIVIGGDPDAAKVAHGLDTIATLLTRISAQLNMIIQQEEQQMADLSALQAEVTENGDAVGSAIALLNGLSQALKDALAANDPAAIQALVDQLDAQTGDLATAVAANTPGAAEPAPEPPVEEPPAEPGV